MSPQPQPTESVERRNAAAAWIEAMRLRTLPVSVAGVILAIAYAFLYGEFRATPAMLCLTFAILAQIASNFANEYYDFRAGLDSPGREGPRRGVTEGDITPRAMLLATYGTLAAACAVGCTLIPYGGWWLIPVGVLIAVGVVAYSTGPYPLSHHGLGEVAVILFFGIIPVCLTFYLQAGYCPPAVIAGSVAAGLMGANVIIVNNYRDADDDRAVGKRTLAVIVGPRFMPRLYALNSIAAYALLTTLYLPISSYSGLGVASLYLFGSYYISLQMPRRRGRALTPLLGMTAVAMLATCAALAIIAAIG